MSKNEEYLKKFMTDFSFSHEKQIDFLKKRLDFRKKIPEGWYLNQNDVKGKQENDLLIKDITEIISNYENGVVDERLFSVYSSEMKSLNKKNNSAVDYKDTLDYFYDSCSDEVKAMAFYEDYAEKYRDSVVNIFLRKNNFPDFDFADNQPIPSRWKATFQKNPKLIFDSATNYGNDAILGINEKIRVYSLGKIACSWMPSRDLSKMSIDDSELDILLIRRKDVWGKEKDDVIFSNFKTELLEKYPDFFSDIYFSKRLATITKSQYAGCMPNVVLDDKGDISISYDDELLIQDRVSAYKDAFNQPGTVNGESSKSIPLSKIIRVIESEFNEKDADTIDEDVKEDSESRE